ncbi:ABC transporter substrate binding protein [Colwelliaceae bacterium 6471]
MACSLNRCVQLLLVVALLLASLSSIAADSALIIRGKTDIFEEILSGLKDDLDNEVTLTELIINKNTTPKDIAKRLQKQSPNIIILMGNKSVNLYASYQEKYNDEKFPPAIAMGALFIDKFFPQLQNSMAIRFEIPAVTSAVAMREIVSHSVKKIGVVYREWMTDIIAENKRYCLDEGIELVGIKLPNKMNNVSKQVNLALEKLSKEVDAMWVLNDNGLLTRDALVNAWLPQRSNSPLPAIVGIKHFITKLPLGSFAIVPDNYALGAQAAGIVFDLKDNDWIIESATVQQPFSIKKFINEVTLKNKGIKYQSNMLNLADEVIQ